MRFFPASPFSADQKSCTRPVVEISDIPAVNFGRRNHGWKPVTFSAGILGPVICATLALFVTLALLGWQNTRNGALFFASNAAGFSTLQTFFYQYLPTIVIVLFGMFWSWIDLDVKRLEPWLQLSEDQGAQAGKSLLLHYPLDFLPFVPFKAAKRRQWTVASASLIMVLVVWAITPLQNGIFTPGVINIPTNTSIHSSNALIPLSQQTAQLTGGFLNEGFSVLWLQQQLPGFTTNIYGLAPFQETIPGPGTNRTLSAKTSLYATELTCNPPANITYEHNFSITFDDGNGCIAQSAIVYPDVESDENYISYYIGYFDDPNTDMSLQAAGCGLNSSHTFLAIWKVASSYRPDFSDSSNATALFCTPTYYTQEVQATVLLPDHSVLHVEALGKRQTLSTEQFNSTQFEYVLANGVPPGTPRADIADNTVLHQDSRLSNMSLVVPAANMVGFAVGATHFLPSDYLNPQTLHSAFQSAHQLLFAIALQSVISPIDSKLTSSGVAKSTLQTIQLVPVFAILAQAFLVVVALLGCHVLYSTRFRKSKLRCDPDSLAQVMQLGRDAQVRGFFNQYDSANARALADALISSGFKLNVDSDEQDPLLCFSQTSGNSVFSPNVLKRRRSEGRQTLESRPEEPFEFRWYTGILFVTFLVFLLGFLIFLRQESLSQNGLRLPSHNAIVQQILINVLPTGVSTIMEPVWVLLSRLACMLRPMEELQKGSASARKSLLLEYTSLPPQLVVWRALRVRHYLLATLSSVALLANVLTVALSGLFSIEDTFHGQPSAVSPLYQAQFTAVNESGIAQIVGQYDQNDAFYVASANFSQYTALPLWTSQQAYFLPLDLNSTLPNNGAYKYDIVTTGYAADLACNELSQNSANLSYQLTFNNNATRLSLITSHIQSDGSLIQCKPGNENTFVTPAAQLNPLPGDVDDYVIIYGSPQGQNAIEIMGMMVSLNNSVAEQTFCGSLLVQGWVRVHTSFERDQSTPPDELGTLIGMNVSSTIMTCQARMKQASFTATFSPSGTVLEAVQNSPFTYQPSPNTNLSNALSAALNIAVVPQIFWHNDTFASDWINYLVKLYTGSASFLDATLPPPSFDKAFNLTSEVFSRVFAIQMSLLSHQLVLASKDAPTIAARFLTLEPRIFISEPLYKISVAILALDLLVAVLFYWTRPAPFLPRLPINLASQIAYFAGSHVIDDIQNAGGDMGVLDDRGYRYGYGKYIGWDGWTHIGIERVPYVTVLESSRRKKRRIL